MPDLTTVAVDEVARRVQALLPAYPAVAGAVLFGSALGACRPDSDIDVGIVRQGAAASPGDALADLGLAEDLADVWGRLGDHPFHVTVLSLRAPFLAFEAVHGGRLVYVRDEAAVTDFLEEVALRYRDEYPRYLAALQDINT